MSTLKSKLVNQITITGNTGYLTGIDVGVNDVK